MGQNYLLGDKSIQINAFMVATAWSLKKMMAKIQRRVVRYIFQILFLLNFYIVAEWKNEFLGIDNLNILNELFLLDIVLSFENTVKPNGHVNLNT